MFSWLINKIKDKFWPIQEWVRIVTTKLVWDHSDFGLIDYDDSGNHLIAVTNPNLALYKVGTRLKVNFEDEKVTVLTFHNQDVRLNWREEAMLLDAAQIWMAGYADNQVEKVA